MQNKGIETKEKNERIKNCGCAEFEGADSRNLRPWLKRKTYRACCQWVAVENKLNCKVCVVGLEVEGGVGVSTYIRNQYEEREVELIRTQDRES